MKARLYEAAVQSTMTHGCEGWHFDETTQRTLNGTNSWMSAVLTGRSAHEEASSPSFDVVEAIKTCRWRWLGNYHVFVDITAVESDNRYGSSMAVCHLFI